ncbi:MAG TPA: (Fe-S)-binding protein [Nitrospirota bacterium]|nr:(Fe-S)-binding protein [Nitrospirota bacterium]
MLGQNKDSDKTVYDELYLIKKEVDRCMKCGNCMAVCPIYGTDKVEAGVARGKVAVIEAVLSGGLSLDDPRVYKMLFNCLVCKSCMQNCPTKVNFDKIMLAMRAALVRGKGIFWVKKTIFSMLKNPKLFDAGMKIGAALSGIVFRDYTSKDQRLISPRAPFALVGGRLGLDSDKVMPEITVKPFRDRVVAVVKTDDSRTKAAFFTGCSINYFYPDTGMDIIEVLKENNVEIHIPKDQNCCGVAVFAHGDVESARMLAKNNIAAMERTGAEYIIAGCGSCGGCWQHDYRELLSGDPIYGPKAEYWSKRIFDISVFLVEIVKYRKPLGKLNAVVTYHDSCHLKKTMKVANEPREIIKNIPGVIFKEMSKPDACCGMGGTYILTHYETGSKIGKKKIEDINKTGADTIATGCPGCAMQLLDFSHRYGKNQEVKHYISLLAESYRKEKRNNSNKR